MASLIATFRAHPRGFWFVFWGELAERASFYGVRTVLALYLIDTLRFAPASAATITSLFIAAAFVTPILGGFLADRFLGRFATIAAFALPYVAGHLVLAAVPSRLGLGVALVLIALGAGAIKPNTSTLMGMIYVAEKKTALLGRAFSYFYAAINVGSALTSLSLPLVRIAYGYEVALLVPALLMVVSFLLFVAGHRHYPAEPPRLPPTVSERAAARQSLRALLPMFAMIAVFWFVYDQSASTWIFFARDAADLELWHGLSISPDQIQGTNPVFILVLTPIFNRLWTWLAARGGREVSDARKMQYGFWIVVIASGGMAIAGALSTFGRVSVWWLLITTFVITLAELCISVVGLELAFRRAAPGTKSAITGAFLATNCVGDVFGSLFAQLYGRISPGAYFFAQMAIAIGAAIVFGRLARASDSRRR